MESKTANTIVKIQSGRNGQYLLNLGRSLVRNRIIWSYSMSLKILMSWEKKVTIAWWWNVTRWLGMPDLSICCLLAPNSPFLATPKPGLCKTPFLLCYIANGAGLWRGRFICWSSTGLRSTLHNGGSLFLQLSGEHLQWVYSTAQGRQRIPHRSSEVWLKPCRALFWVSKFLPIPFFPWPSGW